LISLHDRSGNDFQYHRPVPLPGEDRGEVDLIHVEMFLIIALLRNIYVLRFLKYAGQIEEYPVAVSCERLEEPNLCHSI
jgi:hypothetical protein